MSQFFFLSFLEQFLNPIPSDSINTNNSILHHPQGLRERHLLQQQNEFVSMPHLHLHQRSQMTTPAQTLPLPPRKPWHDQTTMASHHYVNTKNSEFILLIFKARSATPKFNRSEKLAEGRAGRD